jgi:4-hydroxybutyryl-CoA dehydratase/vinylacetyl-CoA-Delta-isomerase
MLMTAEDYRDSLRRLRPRVFLDGGPVDSVADEPRLAPGIAATGVAYDLAHDPACGPWMTARQGSSGRIVNRMLHVDESGDDLLRKLEAVRMVCRQAGCAQRYLGHDGAGALVRATHMADAEHGTDYAARFQAYLHEVQDQDLTLGLAMTDGKGDRALRPGAQADPRAYVHVRARVPGGIVVSGVKAIVTGAAYVHELLVLPSRAMRSDEDAFALACAVPVDAPGVTIVTRAAGRPGEAAATFSHRYGQATAVVIFEDVFVPWERVFLAGEVDAAAEATRAYATHHRHSCIGARAGFGDLLIGAGAMMIEANGLDADRHPHLRAAMVDLIKIVEGFFACGVAASVYGHADGSGAMMPDPVFANIGKLLLATQIYDMHRLAHEVSGGLIVALPGPDEDHNPETAASLDALLAGRADIPTGRRLEVARLIEDLTASSQGGWYSVISLHGGGSPDAMKREIWRNYAIADKRALVESLLDRGVTADGCAPDRRTDRQPGRQPDRQPGRCCVTGCQVPGAEGDGNYTGRLATAEPAAAE